MVMQSRVEFCHASSVILQPVKPPPVVSRGAVYDRVMKLLQGSNNNKSVPSCNDTHQRSTNNKGNEASRKQEHNISSSVLHDLHQEGQSVISSTNSLPSDNLSLSSHLTDNFRYFPLPSSSSSFPYHHIPDIHDVRHKQQGSLRINCYRQIQEESLDWLKDQLSVAANNCLGDGLVVLLNDYSPSATSVVSSLTKQSISLTLSFVSSVRPTLCYFVFKKSDKLLLKNLLNNKSIKTITCFDAHNLLNTLYEEFDILLSGQESWCIFDVKIASYLLQPDLPSSHSINDLTSPVNPTPSSLRPKVKTNVVIGDLSRLDELRSCLDHKLKENQLWELFTNIEMKVAPVIAVMESTGVQVNTSQLLSYLDNLKIIMRSLEAKGHESVGHTFSMTSTTQLREVLFTELQLDLKCSHSLQQTSVHKVTSTSEPVLQQLSSYHVLPGIILQYRQCLKLKGFIDSLLSHTDSKGCLRPKWHSDRTSTGRLACSNPNMQAFPKQPHSFTLSGVLKDTDVSINVRSSVISRPGTSFVTLDFKSIELRLLAHYSQDPSLCRIVQDSAAIDVFVHLTSQWFGMSPENVSTNDREKTKRVVYAITYGVGREKLAEMISSSVGTAQELMKSFLKTFPMVQKFMQDTLEFCRKNMFCVTLCGRKRWFPHITSSNYQSRASSERQAVNFIIQGSAADVCKIAMIKLNNVLNLSTNRLLLQIHDELLYEVPDEDVPVVSDKLKEVAESPWLLEGYCPPLRVPLAVKITTGKNWT